ncbi:coenzyme PQQ synthesis protein D (PqqD) [Caldicellulosiruptor bescii]|uniref:Uncharacterized protein n=2 Tax=Caldicellulosiruptor bescii TaxID=31899 RepID=B9ML64_CALBD|nr:PqqD family protein [Caldicellulosiruptor bescii]ACM61054.1 hypothetical protein Athe_1967 [Caldicellulosiruptor bescii DSM 6725]PBC89132.1 coenzyme PQQ synthesis protein D (PqqD) [Caldicellulosiruptor bescii]PBC91386.1 coenzyme PQQ synthesis protein D (PqqD) [Caldicellulosiruptor bescii]PBD03203.1 coenzyme PQQ synthesis protein D (PqqD) [Caldicellulosiruptor bescii]PBD07184.1 coenzyme PQQ synthesis protein D (PqqD) [Caldicellulosiruptor bescii]
MIDIMKSIPKFDEQNLLYKRLEQDGSLTFLSKKHPETQQMKLNETARFILDKCDGYHTIGEIVNEILKEYKGATKERVIEDVINILHSLWRFGLIRWLNENPLLNLFYQERCENCVFKMLYEDEVIDVLQRLRESPHFVNPYIDENVYYAEMLLRQRVFMFMEMFFSLTVDGKNVLTISFSPLLKVEVNSATVGYFYCEDYSVELEIIMKFLQWCVKKMSEINYLLRDIRRLFFCLKNDNEILFEKLEKWNFRYAGILKEELGRHTPDIIIFHFDIKK